MTTKLERLELNFAPARRNVPLGWVLLALGVIVLAVAGTAFRTAHFERSEQQDALSAAMGRLPGAHADNGARPADARATKAATLVAHELQVPWARMLDALEGVKATDVALLSVEPSATRHQIRITAEAKGEDAMLNYVDALRGDSFDEASLSSHQLENQVPGKPIRFVVQARWRAQ